MTASEQHPGARYEPLLGSYRVVIRTGVQYAPSQADRGDAAHYFPIAAPPPGPQAPPARKRPRLAAALGAELAERVRHERLRDLAVAYDVSHETVRGMLRRQHERELAAQTGA